MLKLKKKTSKKRNTGKEREITGSWQIVFVLEVKPATSRTSKHGAVWASASQERWIREGSGENICTTIATYE